MPTYKSIRTKKVYEEIFDEIVRMIESGDVKPGDQLPSAWQLAEEFGVSRMAVREALNALRARGFVEVKQGNGTFVRGKEKEDASIPFEQLLLMKRQDLLDLLEVRKIVECGVVQAAVMRRTDHDLAEMDHWLQEGRKALTDEKEGERIDLYFHMAVANASHNPILAGVMKHMLQTIHETRRIALYRETATSETLVREHEAIYEAIVAQNSKGAEQAVLEHLQGVEDVLSTIKKPLASI